MNEALDETEFKNILAKQIADRITEINLTQLDVGQRTGLRQPDVSRIVNGSVKNFSTWRLMNILADLGKDITVSIKPALDQRGHIRARR